MRGTSRTRRVLLATTCALALATPFALLFGATSAGAAPPDPSTFSIVAVDTAAGEVGVAVASRFFSVGSVVPYVEGGVGAIAAQASANTSYGPRGLELLARGLSAEEVVRILTRSDDGRESRQVGVVALNGDSATFSGPPAPWAGGRTDWRRRETSCLGSDRRGDGEAVPSPAAGRWPSASTPPQWKATRRAATAAAPVGGLVKARLHGGHNGRSRHRRPATIT
jgi:hypothetical protein